MSDDAVACVAGPLAFIGTGIMGGWMARRLLQAGQVVRVWNRTAGKADALADAGAQVCTSPAECVRGATVVFCMLSSGPVCDGVLLGEQGAIAAMSPGSTLIVMSSIPVETARAQAEAADRRGVGYLDAPVSGGESGARDGRLVIMAGGAADTFDRCCGLLMAMGRPTHVGPAGAGQLAKLVNQMMVATTIASVAEALLLAERGGADPARVREALLGGFADSTVLRQHGLRMIASDFQPGGPAKYQLKDTRTAVGLAAALGLSLPVLGVVDGLFADLVTRGHGDLDHSALMIEMRARQAGAGASPPQLNAPHPAPAPAASPAPMPPG
jgi:3-hydroxyisobutyrate dehydrogenase-like beta-hydroxyacid dehydrogenase